MNLIIFNNTLSPTTFFLLYILQLLHSLVNQYFHIEFRFGLNQAASRSIDRLDQQGYTTGLEHLLRYKVNVYLYRLNIASLTLSLLIVKRAFFSLYFGRIDCTLSLLNNEILNIFSFSLSLFYKLSVIVIIVKKT